MKGLIVIAVLFLFELFVESIVLRDRRALLKQFSCATSTAALVVNPVNAQGVSSSENQIASTVNIDSELISLPFASSSNLRIPRVGYSYYKTAVDQVDMCTKLGLEAGIRYFDVASQYDTNQVVGDALRNYSKVMNIPRSDLFISHKVSNEQQNRSITKVKESVLNEMQKLNVEYLDLCSLHSPLTDRNRRLASYTALQELKEEGLVRAVGVCNFGVKPLEQLVRSKLVPPPSLNLLELSPFNQHKDVQNWCEAHGTLLGCAAWSKLSSVTGPQEGWAVVADLAKQKGVTKAQILVKWSIMKRFVCAPRSGSKSKLERLAIAENSYNGVKDLILTENDMALLNALDEDFRAGKLGRRDGFDDQDVKGEKWDPTFIV